MYLSMKCCYDSKMCATKKLVSFVSPRSNKREAPMVATVSRR